MLAHIFSKSNTIFFIYIRPMAGTRQTKQNKKKASMEIHQMDIQRALSVALAEIDNLKDGLNLCLEASMQISGMNCGGIFLFNDSTGELILTVHKGLPENIVKILSKFENNSETALQAAPSVISRKGPVSFSW